MYDVIVVGAGPSGASSALFLARRGVKVLILEKRKLPRYKVCAGGTARFTFDLLDVPPTYFDAFPIGSIEIIYGDDSKTFPVPSNSIFTLLREQFDYKLTRLACKNGASLIDGEEVIGIEKDGDSLTVKTRLGHTFSSRYIVGADGVGSIVARFVGEDFRYPMPLAVQKDVPEKNPLPVLRLVMGLVPMGYGWVFPKSGTLSIGLGAYRFPPREMPKILESIVERFSSGNSSLLAHPIPFYRGRRRIADDNIVLVGDSAKLVDPFSGEGIRNGIKSAKIASEVVLEGLNKKTSLRVYTERVYRAMARELFLSWIISGIFYRFQERIYHRLDRYNMGEVLANLLNERTSYSYLLRRIFRL
ncbi:MAG: NAD(P)/FAD-dependent oxidoreductase [bacterium]